ESTDDDWHAAIETNLHGFFNCCRVLLPHMMERRSGRIIATGSIIVDTGNFGRNKYAVCTASKGGIVAMVKPLAVEAAPYGITVDCFNSQDSQEGVKVFSEKCLPQFQGC